MHSTQLICEKILEDKYPYPFDAKISIFKETKTEKLKGKKNKVSIYDTSYIKS